MSAPVDVDAAPAAGFVLTEAMPAGARAPWHAHARHQLLYASAGLLRLETAAGQWLLPPQRAAWIPGGARHRVHAPQSTALCTAYLDARLCLRPPAEVAVFEAPPVVQSMLRYAARWDPRRAADDAVADRYFAGLAALCEALAGEARAFFLPAARSEAVQRAMDHALAHLGEEASVTGAARAAGVSPRTLARRFAAEAAMSYSHFVQRARMLRAMALLAGGAQVTEVGFAVGFASTAAFSRAFAAFAGEAPSAFRRRRTGDA